MTRITGPLIPLPQNPASASSPSIKAGDPGRLGKVRSQPMHGRRFGNLDMRNEKTTMTMPRSAAQPSHRLSAAAQPDGRTRPLAELFVKQRPSQKE